MKFRFVASFCTQPGIPKVVLSVGKAGVPDSATPHRYKLLLRHFKTKKAPSKNEEAFKYVPWAGVEPARVLPHWCLRPTRLPIPPPRHFKLIPFLSERVANMGKEIFSNNTLPPSNPYFFIFKHPEKPQSAD